MFEYLSLSDLVALPQKNQGDIFILIDDHIYGERGVIDMISYHMLSPYDGDNWNGITEVLVDSPWLPNVTIWIIHYAFPSLTPADLKIYLEILQYADNFRIEHKQYDIKGDYAVLKICFRKELQKEVERVLRSRK